MIWVYAICERAAATPLSGSGLAGAPLEGIGTSELLAVITRHAEPPDVRAMDAVWAHERVVERLMTEGPVLPMRFGSKAATAAALRTALVARRSELRATLEAVRGRVELAVRAVRIDGDGDRDSGQHALPAVDAAAAPDAGRRFVRRKLQLLERAEAAGGSLHAPLAAAAVAGTRNPGRSPGEVLRASYLVEAAAVAGFRGVARRLQDEHHDVAVLCTGPWPPYSFVDVPVLSSSAGSARASR